MIWKENHLCSSQPSIQCRMSHLTPRASTAVWRATRWGRQWARPTWRLQVNIKLSFYGEQVFSNCHNIVGLMTWLMIDCHDGLHCFQGQPVWVSAWACWSLWQLYKCSPLGSLQPDPTGLFIDIYTRNTVKRINVKLIGFLFSILQDIYKSFLPCPEKVNKCHHQT